MYILYLICFALFLGFPPALLLKKYKTSKPNWGITIFLISIVCWGAILSAVLFYYEHLAILVAKYDNPPDELLYKFSSDGAKKVFALFFGWLYGPIYSVPWLLFYGLASLLRRNETKYYNSKK